MAFFLNTEIQSGFSELPAPEGEGLGVGSVMFVICLYS